MVQGGFPANTALHPCATKLPIQAQVICSLKLYEHCAAVTQALLPVLQLDLSNAACLACVSTASLVHITADGIRKLLKCSVAARSGDWGMQIREAVWWAPPWESQLLNHHVSFCLSLGTAVLGGRSRQITAPLDVYQRYSHCHGHPVH